MIKLYVRFLFFTLIKMIYKNIRRTNEVTAMLFSILLFVIMGACGIASLQHSMKLIYKYVRQDKTRVEGICAPDQRSLTV